MFRHEKLSIDWSAHINNSKEINKRTHKQIQELTKNKSNS